MSGSVRARRIILCFRLVAGNVSSAQNPDATAPEGPAFHCHRVMPDFREKLRLKALAEEDIYFAKRDRELIEALHKRKLAKHLQIEAKKDKKKARKLEEKYAEVTTTHWCRLKKLGKHYRRLISKAFKLVSRKRR